MHRSRRLALPEQAARAYNGAMLERQTANVRAKLVRFSRRLAVVAAAWGAGVAQAIELPLTEGTVLRLAEVREGIEAITKRDDYVRQMSPVDRQIRLQTERDVSADEFLAFVASHVQPWSPGDIDGIAPLVEALRDKLSAWKLRLPPVVLLVKTDGREEAGAAYCRGAAIVLPANMIAGGPPTLARVLPHEVFHVLSSHNPQLREALYQIIGFRACNEVLLPEGLRQRKITNPDAPINDHYLTVEQDGARVEVMPVLLSKAERYETARGGHLFSYLDFKLLVLDSDGTSRRAALRDGRALLLEPASVPGFAQQVGANTKYMIHPEEIMADNFVFLINGRIDLPTPRIVAEMGRVLQDAAEAR
jgi:hypothetical protein